MLISTVICTFNRANILPICLEHIIRQDLPPDKFEVIIINNNSTDNTESVVNDFLTGYSGNVRFRYFVEKKPGLSAARNRGIKESNGEYINFIDDDALLPESYESTLHSIIVKNPEIAGFGGKIMPKYFSHEPAWMSFFTWGLVSKHDLGEKPLKYTKTGLYPTGCNMTYKKSVLDAVGGFDEALLRRCDDKYIAYEIKKKNFEIWYFPELALEHYIDEDRLTNRLHVICKDTGLHEKIRLRKKSLMVKFSKILEYLVKFIASMFIAVYFLITNQRDKGELVVKMRWWFLQGYMQ